MLISTSLVKPVYDICLALWWLVQTIAIWMMVLVTIDRFTCVCRPLVAPSYFNRVTRPRYAVLVFIIGFLYNLPR